MRSKRLQRHGEVASRKPGHSNIATCHFIATYCLVKNDTCTDLIWHILFICKNDAWKFDEFHTSKYAGEKNNSGLVLQDARGENKGPVIMINESILYTVIMFSILPNLNLVAWFANLTFMLCFEFYPFWFQLCCLAVAGCRNYCPSCRDELGCGRMQNSLSPQDRGQMASDKLFWGVWQVAPFCPSNAWNTSGALNVIETNNGTRDNSDLLVDILW